VQPELWGLSRTKYQGMPSGIRFTMMCRSMGESLSLQPRAEPSSEEIRSCSFRVEYIEPEMICLGMLQGYLLKTSRPSSLRPWWASLLSTATRARWAEVARYYVAGESE
jgi:hypothetical protein